MVDRLLPCRAEEKGQKNVNLEMAYGLDVDSFVNAFYRMGNRRGVPEEMLSDNGKNFVAADRELREMTNKMVNDTKLMFQMTSKGIKWNFNPPYALHFCGVFEMMIKAAKRAIMAILSKADVTDETLMTAFTAAEASINSRPLATSQLIQMMMCQLSLTTSTWSNWGGYNPQQASFNILYLCAQVSGGPVHIEIDRCMHTLSR